MYLWERSQWPAITWDERRLSPLLARASREQGRLLGKMEGLGFRLRSEAHLRTLTEDVVKSSEIEGEKLDSAQVRSSIARKLGLDVGGLVPSDRNVDGVVELMVDATSKYAASLTQERLFGWHAALFPTGRSSLTRITVGDWRDDSTGPMQVVSGPVGRQKIHYQAPPANRVSKEMKAFLKWFAKPGDTDGLLVAGLAHLWFVTIHPFDDGNGRIARAIADMALARAEGAGQRFYSMSAQIRRERNDYYEMLEQTQKGSLDVTAWQEWFLELPAARNRRYARHSWFRVEQGSLLGAFRQRAAERATDQSAEQGARWLRGQAHDFEMGKARQVLAGHGLSRHSRPGRAWSSEEGSGRRTQHQLLVGNR